MTHGEEEVRINKNRKKYSISLHIWIAEKKLV